MEQFRFHNMHPRSCMQWHMWAKRKNKPEHTTWITSELFRMKKLLNYTQHWGLVAVMINFHFTLRHFKQLAKNFFISASVPGRNFRERWVRCLKGLVSTTFKETGVWSRAGAEETNCSKNLGKNQDNQMFSISFLKLPVDPKLFANKMYFCMCSKMLSSFHSRNNSPPKTQVLPVTSTNLYSGQIILFYWLFSVWVTDKHFKNSTGTHRTTWHTLVTYLGISLFCSWMHCWSRSINFCGKAEKSTKRPCWDFKLYKQGGKKC